MKTNDDSGEQPRKRGRPRSEASRRAVLDTALDLVQECGGGGITIEAIARKAGVGKQTIYKWWGGTSGIFLEILRENASRGIDDLSAEHDLGSFLASTFQSLHPPVRLILKALMAEAVLDSTLREKFVNEFIMQRRAALSRVLRRAPGLIIKDEALVIDLVFGFMWYRLLLDLGPLDTAEGKRLAAELLGQGSR
jgi:AcrR family transcriptional regulator